VQPTLIFKNLSKSFGATRAVSDVSFDLRSGEIHGLVGENGAGKSTLIRMLAGDHQPDSGTIVLMGSEVVFEHPRAAMEQGIGFVHQIPMNILELSITENLILGAPFRRNRLGLIDWQAEHDAAKVDLERVGICVDPSLPLQDLSPAERQLVAVARALRRRPSVLVLDEVTASLSEPEVQLLHRQIRRLRERGIAILYVSHRLEEIFSIADRVTVLRDGRHIATLDVAGLSQQDLIRHIVGTDIDQMFGAGVSRSEAAHDNVLLELSGVGDSKLSNLNLKVAKGEIVGIAGLAGSGRSRLLKMIYGVQPFSQGQIKLEGKSQVFQHASDALRAGIGLVTEDRIADGFVESLPIWQNVTLPWTSSFSRFGVLKINEERRAASAKVSVLDVKMPGIEASMQQLSGGNQQKAIFARWLTRPIRLLLLNEPTHGVDIKSKSQIYGLIRSLTEKGLGVLMVSSEIEELVGLCDRILVLRNGSFETEISGPSMTKNNVLHMLLGEEKRMGGDVERA